MSFTQEEMVERILILVPNASFSIRIYNNNENLALNPVIIDIYLVDWNPSNPPCPTYAQIQSVTQAQIDAYRAANQAPPTTISWANVTDKPTLFNGDYNNLTNKPTIPAAQVNSDWNAGSGLAQIINKPTIPVILSRSFSTPTFANSTTATQLSTTRDTAVSYTYNGTVTISLLAGQSITATLRYADNAGMTTNPVVVDTSITSNSGVLGLTQVNALKLTGIIPAGKFRQVTFSVSGGATAPAALASGQEILL